MRKTKWYIEYFKKSTIGKLMISAFIVIVGALLGTDGLLEFERFRLYFDYLMYIGLIYPITYGIVSIFNVWILRTFKRLFNKK
tara:strand:+ start:122 stop:370 length:249 start_codon:yes stop_codon:yes gene_type:complete